MKVVAAMTVLACAGSAQAFVPSVPPVNTRSTVVMAAENTPASRGDFIKNAASAAAVLGAIAVPSAAMAEIDNPIVPFLGGSDKIDLNNANVRAYIRLPGMYPNAAGKIVSNGPYKAVSEIYNIKGLTNEEKNAMKKYEANFVIFEPQAMYTIDKFNNGLYR